MPIEFTDPQPPRSKAKLIVMGRPGAGKSTAARALMRGLVGAQGRFCIINTEQDGVAFLPKKDFKQYNWPSPYDPSKALEVLQAVIEAKFDGVIFDSASDIWDGAGGMKDMVDRITGGDKRKSMPAWQSVKKKNRELFAAIMETQDCHVILTMRAMPKLKVKKDEIVDAGDQPDFDYKRLFDPHCAFMIRPPSDHEDGNNRRGTYWFWKDRVGIELNVPPATSLTEQYGAAIGKYLTQIAAPTDLANPPLTVTIRDKKAFDGGKFAFTCDGEVLNTDPKTCTDAETWLVGDKITVTEYKQLADVSVAGRTLPCYRVLQWRGE